MQTIRAVTLPSESRIAGLFTSPELADAFAITLPSDAPSGVESLARILLETPPLWFRMLLGCRDAFVKPFGIQTSSQLRKKLIDSAAAHIDFFPVISVEPHELVIGENDTHLDFRTSVLVRKCRESNKQEVVVTSVVRCHNTLGKGYILLIAPFHRMVVRSMLKRAARKGWR
ncbi:MULTISPECIES: DUF2867 domain-containing protein [unclassified Enterobacter]|jgi:hypothetical protein|uniref:DUF2867 domain-containing protein n=1 Tax=unclassified Enterobacter TaxID=2608935 RepID=UPI0015C77AFE|nr:MULTISPECIES: DUF2867 domain-containing protein [unclassified Enterobacter]MBB3306972.1 hypothetical protein [Enterobacter sp. Sphag1F]NYI15704.1 hypothetical protein [Enterobacter sp. Sphag71]